MSLPLPQCLVFDLGKVLVDFDYGLCAGRVAERSRLNRDQVLAYLGQSPLFINYEFGTITTRQFFEGICRDTGFTGSLEEFSRFFADIFFPIPGMIDLHARLRRAGLPAFIFSNTNELAVNHIRQGFPFFADFNGYILSYEHRAMKPDHRLYEVVEQATGRSGSALLYLDDRLENIETGRQRGWQTIHHQSIEETLRLIRELGLPA